MANPKQPGPIHPSVARYQAGLEDRAKQAGKTQREASPAPAMPNLAQAHAQFDAKKDGPMTLGQISQAQHTQAAVAGGGDSQPSLGADTLAGLAEIKKMADAEKETQTAQATEAVGDGVEVIEKSEPVPLSEEEAEKVAEGMSEIDIEMLLNRMQQDAIQNKEQQEAIKKKVKAIDFADGLMRGEFKQVVPIREGLQVTYRSLTPFENEEIRKMILEMQIQDPRTANLAAERLSFMQTVAAIVMINGNEMPSHLTKAPAGGWTFDEKTFLKKYNLFSNYPAPFIHMLTTHAYWFDMRVRELFTVETAKNS